MLGPYPANQNDADIMKTIIEDPNGLCNFLRSNDVFVLDRGFRNVVKYLEEKNFEVLIPSLKGKRKQFSTEEWVPNIGIYFRVSLFLNNAYGQRLQSDKELSYEILQCSCLKRCQQYTRY